MDSLKLYMSVYQGIGVDYSWNPLKKVDEIVQCIISEIMAEPYDLNRSTFIIETLKLIKIIKMGDGAMGNTITVYPYDVYAIVKALGEKIANPDFAASSSRNYQEYSMHLFRGMQIKGDQQSEMTEVNRILKEIQKKVDEKREKSTFETRRTMNGTSMEKSLERSNNCKVNVQRWHEENQAIRRELAEMQPSISEILQKMMQFSTEITESYVLQFAKMQIELYNLISDNLQYHRSIVNGSNNQDYYNAVSNYQEFMYMIIDNLSAFGVEEISSRNGSRFDGNLHEVIDSPDFSPRCSSVKESVRTGFKYKDIVIQKEKIRV